MGGRLILQTKKEKIMQHDFILLDRSGSMKLRWTEALSSINAYVKGLADDHIDTGVTLAVFDIDNVGAMSFQIIRDRIIPRTWHDVSDKDCTPRGGTPLYDAVVKIASMALSAAYDKTAIIIMTDGEENSSREDRTGVIAKRMLDECRAKGWPVIMLGQDFDNWRQAQSVGNAPAASATVVSGQMVNSMRMTAGKRYLYASGQAGTMEFTDEEKVAMATKPEK